MHCRSTRALPLALGHAIGKQFAKCGNIKEHPALRVYSKIVETKILATRSITNPIRSTQFTKSTNILSESTVYKHNSNFGLAAENGNGWHTHARTSRASTKEGRTKRWGDETWRERNGRRPLQCAGKSKHEGQDARRRDGKTGALFLSCA